ncbi:MAG TPA: phosphoribosyltransferase family protein [Humibacter sp.]|nr:phosphoribosyltransferase family protein [Humibacter sp.]
MIFRDRSDAGRRLAEACRDLASTVSDPAQDLIVLGIPRGGVPVAAEVANALGAPLDVIVVRKLGLPWNDEVAMGAIGEGTRILDERLIRASGVSVRQLAAVEQRERRELASRLERFRGDRAPLEVAGRTTIVVDDGIATGATIRAACVVVRARGARRVIAAVPVSPPDWHPTPGVDADELITLATPTHFFAIGQWYSDFTQTADDEVRAALGAR